MQYKAEETVALLRRGEPLPRLGGMHQSFRSEQKQWASKPTMTRKIAQVILANL